VSRQGSELDSGHGTLQRLVSDSARRWPGATAVSGPDGTLTYAELDSAADRIAAILRARGVGRGDRVVIWLDKSVLAVAVMQAALRLAAVYVPVDGANPAPRAITIARNCTGALVVTDPARAAELAARDGIPGPVQVLDGLPAPGGDGPVTPEQVTPEQVTPEQVTPEQVILEPVGPEDLAYVLYTSGSTGEPKGVSITHRNAMAFVCWAAEAVGARAEDRFANHAPFGFDLSVFDLYAAFLVGASVQLIPSALAYAPQQLVDFLVREQITVWYSVPSALGLMVHDGGLLDQPAPPALRALLFAGEPFPVPVLTALFRHLPGVRFLNLYGPTETNVCTFHEVTGDDLARGLPIPIGRACSGDEVWAERPDGSRAGPGEEGELVVAGPTVMAGYWGHPPQRGPYRTGDLVRVPVRADGGFDYLGRRDHMVKVRGHRVELGEVEVALGQHPAVHQVAVVVVGTGTAARLAAFVVPVERSPGLLELKRHCAERLPRYMIIDSVTTLAELPRTPNGKTDRRRLGSLAAAPSTPEIAS
jgi:amino acid adenylation domain-containing protein